MTVAVTIVVAALSMVVADVLSVLLTQAEARDHAVLAGVFDTLGWLAGLVVTLAALDALNGHDRPLMYGVIGAVSVANFAGSYAGVRIGKRFVSESATKLAERVGAVEAKLVGSRSGQELGIVMLRDEKRPGFRTPEERLVELEERVSALSAIAEKEARPD